MKILYVANSRFPSERAHMVQIVKMCNAFSKNGAEVTLQVTDRNTNIIKDAEEYYGEKLKFEVKKTKVISFIQYNHFLPSLVNKFLYLIQRLTFLRGICGEDYDLIYSRDYFLLYKLGRRYGFEKIVYESHDARYNNCIRKLLDNEVKMVVLSEGIFDFYKQQGISAKQMLVAHNGIDDSFFDKPEKKKEARLRLGLSNKDKIVMYIGGFDKWKGVETFFKASELFEEVKFVAIGGKTNLIEEYRKIYPKMIFLGPKPYHELRDNQQAADILVVPNTAENDLSEKYTSPLKFFAHATSGVPLVVSDIQSLRNVVRGQYVTFVNSDSVNALSDGIKDVFSNYETKLNDARELKNISRQCTWKNRANLILKFIQN